MWTITVTDCVDEEFFQLVYGISTYLSLFVFLCAIWLLSWRLYSKPNTKLFSLKGYLALEGFLFTQIFWGGSRVVSCLILVFNLFPNNWIVHEMSFDITWLLGSISVATYLAGVLRTIPRMHFYRQNPHYQHSLHLPTLRGIAASYFSYVILLGTIVTTCAFFTGRFRMQDPREDTPKIIQTLMAIHYSTYSISCLVVALLFIIYGSKLVEIASEGLHLLKAMNGHHPTKSPSPLGPELELKHKKLKRSVRKMRLINMAFIISFVWMGITLAVFAFFHDQIFQNLLLSKIIAAVANWMPMMLNVGVMASIAYGEMRVPDKSEPVLNNIVIHTSPPPSASHSRNTSTDSDTPLLRWPAPVIMSPVGGRRRSASIGSSTTSSPLLIVPAPTTFPAPSTVIGTAL